MTDEYQAITLTFRDGITFDMPRNVVKYLAEIPWYFSQLVTTPINHNETRREFTLWYDSNTMMSLFDSLELSQLVVHDKVNLSYLLGIARYMCVPEWLVKKIEIAKENYDKTLSNDTLQGNIKILINEIVKYPQCINCKKGFDPQNNKESCHFHFSEYQYDAQTWRCCDKNGEACDGCRIGYHTLGVDYLETLMKIYRDLA